MHNFYLRPCRELDLPLLIESSHESKVMVSLATDLLRREDTGKAEVSYRPGEQILPNRSLPKGYLHLHQCTSCKS